MTSCRPVVLVLEDEALISLDLEVALVEGGYMVVLSSSCAEAARFLADNRPSAAVLDIRLRDGECVAVAKALVAQGVPFVVHSGAHLPNEDQVFKLGSLVRKPNDAQAVVAALRSALIRP